jgi:hypothetical protein
MVIAQDSVRFSDLGLAASAVALLFWLGSALAAHPDLAEPARPSSTYTATT